MSTRLTPTRRFAATLTLAVASAFAVNVFAMPGGPGGAGGHAMGGGALMGGMLPRMLERVNATPEQRAQIQKILDANVAERGAQREAARALREQAMVLFTQPTVDANEVEALRRKQMALHDDASKRMSAALIEISRVLTLEQRKQMADEMAQRREMMRRHYRERQGLDAPKS
jgi:Spy/CpxP family protein refolding chaperone